jgi:hypothetical protein
MFDNKWIETLKYDEQGLIPAIAQRSARWHNFDDAMDESSCSGINGFD